MPRRPEPGRGRVSQSGKRALDIEELLGWAYRAELPKLEWLGIEGRFSFAAMPSRCRPGANCGFPGSTPFFDTLVPVSGGRRPVEDGGADPDALAIAEAVAALDGGRIAEEIGEDPRKLFSDMPKVVQAEAPAALASYLPRLKDQVANIVVRSARLGRRPAWHDGEAGPPAVPELRAVVAPNGGGQPLWFVMEERPGLFGATIRVEADGYDRVKRRPKPGAYHKYYFDPDPRLVIDERADYRAWRIALRELAAALDERLVRHQALPPKAEEWPWS